MRRVSGSIIFAEKGMKRIMLSHHFHIHTDHTDGASAEGRRIIAFCGGARKVKQIHATTSHASCARDKQTLGAWCAPAHCLAAACSMRSIDTFDSKINKSDWSMTFGWGVCGGSRLFVRVYVPVQYSTRTVQVLYRYCTCTVQVQ